MVTKRETATLVKGVPERVLLLLDGAYHEYLDGMSNYDNGMRYLKRHKNLIVTRTFSKAYGLAGLRIGYGIASPEIIETLNRVRPPFNVTRIAQEAALAALDDDEHLKNSRELNNQGIAYYEKEFDRLGLEWIPSFANFITVNTRRDGGAVFQALLERGIIVRPMAGYRMPGWLRISIGLPNENKRCIRELEKAIKQIPEAQNA